jgi:ABC-type glycerol-3-phosphate transport system substrate-binding protein
MQRNNITRRKFLQGVAVTSFGVVGAQLMAACAAPAPAAPSGETTEATESSAAPAATDVSLRVQAAPEGGQAVMPTVMGERYQADSGVEVIIEETIYGEIETKTQTGFISGTLQDLLYGHHRWLFVNYLKGIYMEIDDFLASDAPEDYDDIYPSVMAGNSLDGKNFSFPGVVHPGGNISINYNKTLLEEKGLPLPNPVGRLPIGQKLPRPRLTPTMASSAWATSPCATCTTTATLRAPLAAQTAPKAGS